MIEFTVGDGYARARAGDRSRCTSAWRNHLCGEMGKGTRSERQLSIENFVINCIRSIGDSDCVFRVYNGDR